MKRLMSFGMIAGLLVMLLLLTMGCSDLLGPTSEVVHSPADRLAKDTWTWHTEKVIGPEGGTLVTNLTKLTVPPGALDEPINLTLDVTAYAPVGLGGALNRTYDFSPHGTVFNEPVTLELSFHDADLQGIDPDVLYISYYDETTEIWEDLGGTVDVAGQRVFFSGQLPHFSRYGLSPSP